MAGKQRLLKAGALMGLLFLGVCLISWWRLPDVLNLVVNQQLKKQGFEDSAITFETAGASQLEIREATIQSPGWSVEMTSSKLDYSLGEIFQDKEVHQADVDTLLIHVKPEELPPSDEPLTLNALQFIPVRETRVRNGQLNLELSASQLQILWTGTLKRTEENILSLNLSRLEVRGINSDGKSTLEIQPIENTEGLLQIDLAIDGTSLSINWQLPSLNVVAPEWQLTEGSSSGDIHFNDLELRETPLTNTSLFIPALLAKADGEVSYTLNEFVFNSLSAQWISGSFGISPGQQAPESNSILSMNVGTVAVAGKTLEQASLRLENRGNMSKMRTQGMLQFLFEGTEAKIDFSHTSLDLDKEMSLNGEYSASPLTLEYSDLPGRFIPGFEDMIFNGTLTANGDYWMNKEATDASTSLELQEGSISIPNNNLEASGIESILEISSLRNFRSTEGESNLSIDQIQLGDLPFQNTEFLFDLLNAQTITFSDGSTNLFDGTLRLRPATFVLNPVNVETAIAFEHLSLKAIVDGMDLFDGTMEGAISGHLPIQFKNGKFETSTGFLELSEGVPARLNYNTKDMFAPKQPEEKGFLSSIGDKILEKLKLAPENVVEDALSDLTIHELRIDLLPEDSPNTPARIHLAGEGVTGTTTVPMILDTNINGTTDELLQFLLRIHSLGTPSLEPTTNN
ncbi:MAG: YdbH domain-containing protein [Opitutales bacterium]|nr:YdbH domain-containing protein [Opitutales bacterium]